MPSLGLIILLLLIALPLLEIAVLIKAGAVIGIWLTLTIIVVTFILGTMVVRLQGFGVMRRAMAATRSGEPPVEPMMEGLLLMFAGGCLIAPGLITDTIGFLLLIPMIRQIAARWVLARGFPIVVRMRRGRTPYREPDPYTPHGPSRRSGPAPTIEADYERIDEQPAPPGRTPPTDHSA